MTHVLALRGGFPYSACRCRVSTQRSAGSAWGERMAEGDHCIGFVL